MEDSLLILFFGCCVAICQPRHQLGRNKPLTLLKASITKGVPNVEQPIPRWRGQTPMERQAPILEAKSIIELI